MNMPKSSKKQINEDEKKLLKVLQTSSGDNIENIAKKCGFSRQKVSRIKKRLEKDKTIWGYKNLGKVCIIKTPIKKCYLEFDGMRFEQALS